MNNAPDNTGSGARLVSCNPQLDSCEEAIREAALIVLGGGVIAFPTDTFYGLGCDPFNEKAVERIFYIKRREPKKPLPLLIGDLEEIDRLARNLPEEFYKITNAFWPGPITLVLEAADSLPQILLAGERKVGIRLPRYQLARQLTRACGGVITATSANLSGQPSAATAQEVIDQIGDQIDLVLDGGQTSGGAASTVLDLTVKPMKMLREGPIGFDALKNVL